MVPGASEVGSGPLGREPCAAISIAFRASAETLGKPFARGKLNGVWPGCEALHDRDAVGW